MPKAKLTAKLSQTSLNKLEKDLQSLAEALNKSTEETTKELGEKSLEFMTKQYSKNKMGGHIGNLNLKAYKRRYKNGFIISSGDDEVAVYNEFGTGIVGENSNPLADEVGYEYNVPSVHKGVIPEGAIAEYGAEEAEKVTTPDTWWYYKNNKWWYTKGMKGKNMFSSLVDELRDSAIKEYKVGISKVIGKYGGK